MLEISAMDILKTITAVQKHYPANNNKKYKYDFDKEQIMQVK